MSIDPQTSRFWKETLRHGLLDEATLRSCWDAIPPEKRDDPEAIDRRLARQAIASNRLTLWQSQQVLAGRASALKIGKYLVVDIIGRGGMGLVFLARDTRLHRPVAIKILSRERMASPRAMARFEREAKVGAQLQHDNLVRIYDEGEHRELRYLVMEYIEGRNVAQILHDVGRLSPALAASIVRQVALGLEHARLKGLIHRDVNPQNILVTRDGTAKLTDLGLAIDLGDPDDVVTRDGATVGTFDYISPEQARHPRSVDTRSDLYSLGCTLYHMISGRVPFPEASLPEKLYAHQLHEPEPLSDVVPDLPRGLEAIVRRLMAKSPDDRFPTPAALVEALDPYAEGASSVAELLAAARRPAADSPQMAAQTPESPPRAGAEAADGRDPNGYRLGPPIAPSELAPTRTASAMKPDAGAVGTARLDHASPDPDRGMSPSRSNLPGPSPSRSNLPGTEPEPDPGPLAPVSNGLGLPIDLGPELSLTESLAASRSRSRVTSSRSNSNSGSSDSDSPGAANGSSSNDPDAQGVWLKRLGGVRGLSAVAGLFGLLVVGMLLSKGCDDPTPPTEETTTAGDREKDEESGERVAESLTNEPGFSVGAVGGVTIPCPSFQDALMLAPNNGSTIYLSDSTEPFQIAPEQAAFLAPRSSVLIRPLPGSRPTIVISLEGNDPWLRQSIGSLTLEDLNIIVRYGGSAPPDAIRPPLIEGGGSGELTLRRCTFAVQEGPSQGSGVVRSSFGAPVRVEGCLFRGFDRALDLVAFGGVQHEVSNSVFVWTRGTGGQPSGWPVRIANRYSNLARPARLTIDRCSVLLASGIVETTSLLADQPLEIRVTNSGIRAEHLLCWTPPSELESFPSGLQWQSSGNRYDIQSAAWIVSTPDGLSSPDSSPSTVDSWVEALGERGQDDSRPAVLKLRIEAALESQSVDPNRFVFQSDGEAFGADPAQVGPAGGPPAPRNDTTDAS